SVEHLGGEPQVAGSRKRFLEHHEKGRVDVGFMEEQVHPLQLDARRICPSLLALGPGEEESVAHLRELVVRPLTQRGSFTEASDRFAEVAKLRRKQAER